MYDPKTIQGDVNGGALTTQAKVVKVLVDFVLLAVGAGLVAYSVGVPADRLVAGVFGAYTIVKVVLYRQE